MMMNNNVSVPRSYFVKTAQRDYNYPMLALVREFLQNSRDAGATEIHFNLSESDGRITLVVKDNGVGMDRDTITGKLMALGESGKGNDSTGGFGVAKILLFFAHEKYTIETRDLVVSGEGGSYRIDTSSEYTSGVRATVVLAGEVLESCYCKKSYKIVNLFRNEIRKSYLPKLAIFVDGERVEADLKQGKAVEEIDKGMVLHKRNTEGKECYIAIRVRGLHMFEMYTSEARFKLIVELDGYSVEYLTTNRDGLRGDFGSRVGKICQSYVLNSAKGKKSTVNLFEGKSSRFSEQHEELLAELNSRIAELGIDDEDRYASLTALFGEAKDKAPELSEALSRLEQRLLGTKILNGTDWVPLTVKDLELDHHYFVETVGKKKLPGKWEPQNFNMAQTMVLELWSKILSMVLADADLGGREFNVGYVLDDGSEGGKALAKFRTRGDVFLFLLNPLKYGNEKRLPIKRSRRLELVMWLMTLAIHEVNHAAGYDHHNEEFICAESELKRKCFLRIREYLKL